MSSGRRPILRYRPHLVALLALAPLLPAAAAEDGLEPARAAFRIAYAEAERGEWQAAERYSGLLDGYVLWPDLRAAWLRARVTTEDHAVIEAFLDRFGRMKPARELRYLYALHLADTGRNQAYLDLYDRYYAGLDVARLDCLALDARIRSGEDQNVAGPALDLWLVGRSQADECDPVFDYLRRTGKLTADAYRARFQLAIDAKQFSLARYLARDLDTELLATANAWLSAARDPEAFAADFDKRADTETDRQQLAYAIESIAWDEPLAADALWQQIRERFSFEAGERERVDRTIALWAARNHLPEAVGMLSALTGPAADTEATRWRIRAELRDRNWHEVVRGIEHLPPTEAGREEWRYWKAMALTELDDHDAAAPILQSLAGERSYYGFLAADAIRASYALDDDPVLGDDELTARLLAMPELVRARELFYVGLEGRGRSEWDAAVSKLDSADQEQAALLAHRWGWHSRAISTLASAGRFDDLSIRYPLPWKEAFVRDSASAGIDNSWAYGVARSESLFMRDIRSSAGAIGIMQLMPDTGQLAARELRIQYGGRAALTDSATNIRFGTWYLGKVLERFGDNRVLATAAYNAGALRVENWLPSEGGLDARVWIENIPYNETRDYVRRVLTDEVIFNWKLTGRLRRLSAGLAPVPAPTGDSSTSSD